MTDEQIDHAARMTPYEVAELIARIAELEKAFRIVETDGIARCGLCLQPLKPKEEK